MNDASATPSPEPAPAAPGSPIAPTAGSAAPAVAGGHAQAEADAEIKRLQARKLSLEIQELERPWWRSKDVVGFKGSVLIGLLGLGATTVTGFCTTAERIDDATRRQLVSEAIAELDSPDIRQREIAGRRLALLDERFNLRELKKAYGRSLNESRSEGLAGYRTPFMRVGAIEAVGQNFSLWRHDPEELAMFLRSALKEDPSVLARHKAIHGLLRSGQLGVTALQLAYEEDKKLSAAEATTAQVFGGSVIGIPEGWSVIGLDQADDSEGPASEHKLAAFWIDATPVSNAQWNAHMKSQPAEWSTPHAELDAIPKRKKMLREARLDPRYAALPVVGVTWFQAQRYCQETGKRRLPSQAEWEIAARGRVGWIYPWGAHDAPATRALQREASRKILMKAKDEPSFPHVQALSVPIEEDVSPFKVVGMVSSVRQWTRSEWSTRQLAPAEDQECRINCVLKGSAGFEDGTYAFAWRFRPTRRVPVSIASEPYADDNVGFRCASAQKPIELKP